MISRAYFKAAGAAVAGLLSLTAFASFLNE